MRYGILGILGLAIALAGCEVPPPEPQTAPDGTPLPTVTIIQPGDRSRIKLRMIDSVNTLRAARGLAPLEYDRALNSAALTHARDMSVQNRPWHFGSDGSSPIDRVARAGYRGRLLGENISETYETDVQTLNAWMTELSTRSVIMDPNARHLGFDWFQEPNGKLWWTLITGAPPPEVPIAEGGTAPRQG